MGSIVRYEKCPDCDNSITITGKEEQNGAYYCGKCSIAYSMKKPDRSFLYNSLSSVVGNFFFYIIIGIIVIFLIGFTGLDEVMEFFKK